MFEELHIATGGVHHAGGLVHHHHRPGTGQRARFGNRIEVQADVEVLREQHHHRGPAGLERLQLAVLPHAAPVFLDQLADRRAVFHFIVARPVDVPAHAPQPCPGSGWRTDRLEPVGAVEHDMREVADGLDVVDHGRLTVEALDRRERRLEARLAAVALKRGQHGRLFAANVGAGAAVQDDVDVVALAQDVLAEVPGLAGLVDGRLQRLRLRQVLAPDVDEGQVAADRVARDQDALQHLVRAVFHQVPILEAARLALIRVADQVARIHPLWQEAPLVPGRKAGAATAAQAARLDQVDQRIGLHLDRLFEAGVAAGLLVDSQLLEPHQFFLARGLAGFFGCATSSPLLGVGASTPSPLWGEPGRGSVLSRSMMASMRSGVKFSSKRWSTCIMGAPPQAPRHSIVECQVMAPSEVVAPSRTPNCRSR